MAERRKYLTNEFTPLLDALEAEAQQETYV